MKIGRSPVTILLTALVLQSISTTVLGASYKYIGKNGEIIYSQTPPRSGSYERIDTGKRGSSPETKRVPSAVERLEQFTRGNADKEKAEKLAAEQKLQAEQRDQNCVAARHNLTIYSGPPNRLIKDATGNFSRLTSEERDEKIAEAKKMIEEFCD